MGKKLFVMIGLITIITSCIVYIDQRYFFNPVVFSKDVVTPHDWSNYERPLILTYYSLEGERQAHRMEHEEDIHHFLEAMKNSPRAENPDISNEVDGALKLSSNNKTLLEAYFYADHWHVLKQDRTIYEMTHTLQQLIDKF